MALQQIMAASMDLLDNKKAAAKLHVNRDTLSVIDTYVTFHFHLECRWSQQKALLNCRGRRLQFD